MEKIVEGRKERKDSMSPVGMTAKKQRNIRSSALIVDKKPHLLPCFLESLSGVYSVIRLPYDVSNELAFVKVILNAIIFLIYYLFKVFNLSSL